jgi:hypothetical protein
MVRSFDTGQFFDESNVANVRLEAEVVPRVPP